MSKSHRGRGIREVPNRGRGTCPVCKRTGIKAMYEQDPRLLYPMIREPVLICAADDGSKKAVRKRQQVQAAIEGLKQVEVVWFQQAAHDIHVDQPAALAATILNFADR